MKKVSRNYTAYIKGVFLPTVIYGGFTGFVTGCVIFLFHYIADLVINLSYDIYSAVSENLWLLPVIFIGLIVLALLSYLITKKAPNARGVGIPRSQGVIRGLLPMKWLKEFAATFAGSLMTLIAGVPLGVEGPSVFLGTTIGGGISKLPFVKISYSRYLMTCGSGAGFAASCKAPLTALLFSLEELNRKMSPMFITLALTAVVFSSVTTELLSGLFGEPHAFFTLGEMSELNISDIWVPVMCGIAAGLCACLFNTVVGAIGKLSIKKTGEIWEFVKIVSVFILSGIFALLLSDSVHHGGNLINGIIQMKYSVSVMLILLGVKFLLVPLAASSGAVGGIFIPVLSIGAILGGLLSALSAQLGLSAVYSSGVIIITVAAFMAGTMQVPLTAVVFIMESTHSFDNALFVIIAVFLSYSTMRCFRAESIYDVILERMVKDYRKNKKTKVYRCDYTIPDGSFAEGKLIGDLFWPQGTIVRLVESKQTARMDSEGNHKLDAGDKLLLQFETCDLDQTIIDITSLIGGGEPENLRETSFVSNLSSGT